MAQTAIQKLQEIADIFNVESARISGDPKDYKQHKIKLVIVN